MLTLPPINYRVPKDIYKVIYVLGYRYKYRPYSILEDIANVAAHWKKTGKPSGFIGGNMGINKKYKEFLYSIPYDLCTESSPYYMSVEIIKKLSTSYNFREIENSLKAQNNEYTIVKKEYVNNPTVDLSIFSEEVIDILGVSLDSHISNNIINILKFSKTFKDNLQDRGYYKYEKMVSYNQITSIPKFNLVLPNFKYKYTLKKYNISKGRSNEIVLYLDVTESSKVIHNVFKGLLLYFLNTWQNRNITIYELAGDIKNVTLIQNTTELKEYYNKNIRYYRSILNFKNSYIKENTECYIISEGKYDNYPKVLNCVVNGISKSYNKDLQILCKNTKGKYIKL